MRKIKRTPDSPTKTLAIVYYRHFRSLRGLDRKVKPNVLLRSRRHQLSTPPQRCAG
jgi:hypothetical protein